MRLAALFFRSRRAGYAFAAVAFVALLALVAGWTVLSRPTTAVEYLAPVLIFAALAAACVVGAGVGSPFGEAEKTAGFLVPILRLFHLVVLLAGVVGIFLALSLAWDRPVAAATLVRGLLGLSGLAFLTSLGLGARLCWMLPVVFVAIIPFVGDGPADRRWAWWAWVDQPSEDPTSWLLASALCTAGLVLVCLHGARDPAGGTE